MLIMVDLTKISTHPRPDENLFSWFNLQSLSLRKASGMQPRRHMYDVVKSQPFLPAITTEPGSSLQVPLTNVEGQYIFYKLFNLMYYIYSEQTPRHLMPPATIARSGSANLHNHPPFPNLRALVSPSTELAPIFRGSAVILSIVVYEDELLQPAAAAGRCPAL